MKEVGTYRWGASRDDRLVSLVYGAFRDLGFSVLRMGEGLPHFLVARDGVTALVLVGITKKDGTAHGGRKQEASIRAFLSSWQGQVFDVCTREDVAYAANRMEVTGRVLALAEASGTLTGKRPDA